MPLYKIQWEQNLEPQEKIIRLRDNETAFDLAYSLADKSFHTVSKREPCNKRRSYWQKQKPLF